MNQMPTRRTVAFFLLFFFIQSFALAVNNFPYIDITIKVPAQEDPYPGIGNNYSSLSKGIETVLWNPAGLAKIKEAELLVGFPSTTVTSPFTKHFSVSDTGIDTSTLTGDITEVGTTFGISLGVIFSSDPKETTFSTHEYTGHLNYSTVPTGSNYKQSIKVADWLAFGISTHGETGYAVSFAGDFPAQLKMAADFFNITGNDQFSVDNGKLTVVYSPEGSSGTSYTTAGQVWEGFLKQDQRMPFITVLNARNDLSVQSNLTLTSAAKWGKFSAGANITPISALYNIDNSLRVIFDGKAPDLFIQAPDIDFNNEADISQWVSTPNLYETQSGYKKEYFLRIPAGENVAEFRYKGSLAASAFRLDLGAMYDLSEDLTLGFAFENFNKSQLDFKAIGRSTYINYRALPGFFGSPEAFPDSYTNITDPSISIEDEKIVPIPQRIRIGATLRKPYLITLDYEIQPTPMTFRLENPDKTYSNLVFNDIRFIRAGAETQVFSWPVYLRAGTILMLKPQLSGEDRLTRETFESMFAYGFYPLKLDLGIRYLSQNYEFGAAGGMSILSLMSPFSVWWLSTPPVIDYRNKDLVSAIAVLFPAVLTTNSMGDTVNQDFGRLAYFNASVKRDNWQVIFQNAFDIGSTGAAYNITANRRDVLSWIKWITTLTVSISF